MASRTLTERSPIGAGARCIGARPRLTRGWQPCTGVSSRGRRTSTSERASGNRRRGPTRRGAPRITELHCDADSASGLARKALHDTRFRRPRSGRARALQVPAPELAHLLRRASRSSMRQRMASRSRSACSRRAINWPYSAAYSCHGLAFDAISSHLIWPANVCSAVTAIWAARLRGAA